MAFVDLQNELYTRLSIGATSTFYTDKTSTLSYVKSLINQAYSWAHGLFDWRYSERAVYTTTSNDSNYYDYPTTPYIFKTDGIIRIEIDSSTTTTPDFKKYEKLKFQAFLDFKNDQQNATLTIDDNTRYFSDYDRKIFLYPVPPDDMQMNIWGIIRPAALSADADVTIFDVHEPDAEEAIIKKAESIALAKAGQKQLAQAEEAEAEKILNRIYDRYQKRQGVSRADKPFWEYHDYFSDDYNQVWDRNLLA